MEKDIMSEGFGTIPKLVMRDCNLSAEAKTIYAYICSFAGAGNTAFPSIELMVKELKMSKKRFLKYRKELIDNKYISIFHQRNNEKQGNNIYFLKQTINIQWGQNDFQGCQIVQNQGCQIVQNQGCQNVPTNNNNINNNNININNNNNKNINNNIVSKNNTSSCCQDKIFKIFEELGFGLLNRSTMEFIEDDIETYGELWVRDALKEASKRGKYNLKYAEGILKNWKANGRSDSNEFGENNSNDNEENEEHIYDGYDFSKFYVKNTGEAVEDIETDF